MFVNLRGSQALVTVNVDGSKVAQFPSEVSELVK